MSSPAPDPAAPVCSCCQANSARACIRETLRTMQSIQVAPGVFWDADGRRHEHFGTAPGAATYRCDCGHTWIGAFQATLYPCWCGFGRST